MAEQLRMPPFFPLSPAACKAETEAFFTAFSAQAAFSGESKEQAGVGRAALQALAPELERYTACVRKHMVKRELAQAPQHYTQQLAAQPPSAPAK